MCRRYEDPYELERYLEEAEKRLAKDPDNIDIMMEIEELKDRIRFAWDDDEAEMEGR